MGYTNNRACRTTALGEGPLELVACTLYWSVWLLQVDNGYKLFRASLVVIQLYFGHFTQLESSQRLLAARVSQYYPTCEESHIVPKTSHSLRCQQSN